MRAVVQRVTQARVEVAGEVVGQVDAGLLVYLGAGRGDSTKEARWMASKIAGLRIFEDANNKMNLSASELTSQVLVVSQFTLYGDVRKGRRPSFDCAAPPKEAFELYEEVMRGLRDLGLHVESGKFRADMQVYAQVDGPVTILVDSERVF